MSETTIHTNGPIELGALVDQIVDRIAEKMQSDRYNLISLKEVRKITGLGPTKIYELIKTGDFPEQIPLGKNCVRWRDDEVYAWNNKQVEAARRAR